jgi:hypothetical protein
MHGRAPLVRRGPIESVEGCMLREIETEWREWRRGQMKSLVADTLALPGRYYLLRE